MKQDDRVVVSRAAVEWLKTHYPQLCIKAGLCESVGGRLYTKTFSAAPEARAQSEQAAEPVRDERAAFEAYYSENGKWPAAIQRRGDSYILGSAQSAWTVWQARAAIARIDALGGGE